MNKFTKSMTAFAVSALIAGPAAAVEFDVFYSGSKAKVSYKAADCKSANEKNLDMTVDMFGDGFIVDPDDLDFDAGDNTGLWEVTVFSFAESLDGEGLFIISQTGKTKDDAPIKATMDVSQETHGELINAIDGYLNSGVCKDGKVVELFPSSCQITKGDAKWGKKGETLTVKMDMQCQYENDKGKDKSVTLKILSGKMTSAID